MNHLTSIDASFLHFESPETPMHVGSLMQIMVLRWLQKTGHKPVVLMGGNARITSLPLCHRFSRMLRL